MSPFARWASRLAPWPKAPSPEPRARGTAAPDGVPALAHRARVLSAIRYQQALALRDKAEMARAVADHHTLTPLTISATKSEDAAPRREGD